MKKYIKKFGWTAAGIVAGSIGGYLYWKFVGCSSGSCAITSNPLNSTAYGALMGGLLFSAFGERKKETV